MRTIPRQLIKKIEFFEYHIDQWAANAQTLGITAQTIAELGERLAAARAAYDTAQALRQKAKSATTRQNAAIDALMELGSAIVATIRARAKLSGDETTIYATSRLAPAKTPAPLPPPAMATNLSSTLLNSGALRLDWEGTTANGTCYTIWRQLDPDAPATLLGAVCARSFVDETLPAGTPEAIYFVRTHRGERISEDSTPIVVRFGVVDAETSARQSRAAEAASAPLAA